MDADARPAQLAEIAAMRELYRREMDCQVIHDSLHVRKGWTRTWLLTLGGATAGYGSVALAGPWTDKPTAFEFFVLPDHRSHVFDLFGALLRRDGAGHVETQSNDPLLTVMLHTFCRDIAAESILFHDRLATSLPSNGAAFRRVAPDKTEWVLELDAQTAATGGLLWHYNPPYGDIYMEVAEPFRRRGLGSYLVQEIKRACRERGGIPAARCNVDNLASRKTLQKAGFVPCGNILTGTLNPSRYA